MSDGVWRHLLVWLAALGVALLVGWMLAKMSDRTLPHYDPAQVGLR